MNYLIVKIRFTYEINGRTTAYNGDYSWTHIFQSINGVNTHALYFIRLNVVCSGL